MNQQPIVEKTESSFRGMIRWATALVVTIVVGPAPLAFAQDEGPRRSGGRIIGDRPSLCLLSQTV